MDDKKIAALAKKNAAKAAKSAGKKGFGKKYDKNLADIPTDEATLKERQEQKRFFKEMRKREFYHRQSPDPRESSRGFPN